MFQLDPAFEEGSAGLSFLVTADPDELLPVETATIRRAISEGFKVVYVLTIHPYARIKDHLPHTMNASNTVVIDCISREIAVEELPEDNITYLDSPAALDRIVTQLGVAVRRFDHAPIILIMDSVRGILGYNTEAKVQSFLQTLTEKAETFDMRFKLFKSAQDLPRFEEELTHLFKDRIHVSESTAPTVFKDGPGVSIHLPSSIASHLSWNPGERLDADLIDEDTLHLTREKK